MTRKRTVLITALAAVSIAAAFGLGWRLGRDGHPVNDPVHEHDLQPVKADGGEIEYWTCTMHPSVKMKEPSKCPICAMDLVAVKKQVAATEHEHDLQPVTNEEGEIKYWTCTMHPSVKMKEPGKCPICAMDLVPVRKESGGAGEGRTTESAAAVPEKSLFTVDPRRQQMIGVRTAAVATRRLDRTISTIGRVSLDERRITHVHTKFSGWISKVFVDYTWQHVRKGEPLFTIYSPELVSTQEEYLLAVRAQSTLGDHAIQEVSGGARSLLKAARRRLLLWDISEDQIEKLARTGEVRQDLVVHSPAEGHVTHRNAFENMRVEPGTKIYTIADHSSVWVHVEIYENDISLVRLGQHASMTVESYPGRRFFGKVTYIEPHLMEQTRTLRVRLEFSNADLTLKPGMYAKVKLNVASRTVIAVPESAVLRTGERDIVFVDHGEGRMELRRIQLGGRAGDYYAVLKGLKTGEKIVVAGNFLIDAESKVQGVIASWEGAPRP